MWTNGNFIIFVLQSLKNYFFKLWRFWYNIKNYNKFRILTSKYHNSKYPIPSLDKMIKLEIKNIFLLQILIIKIILLFMFFVKDSSLFKKMTQFKMCYSCRKYHDLKKKNFKNDIIIVALKCSYLTVCEVKLIYF